MGPPSYTMMLSFPVPGLCLLLSQPAFLLGIKQAGYLAGPCAAEGLCLESVILQGRRMPDMLAIMGAGDIL